MGEEQKFSALYCVDIPASIGSFNFRSKTQIIEGFLPFLLSIRTMKMGANLKLSDGILTIDSAGVSVAVETLESALIAVSIVTQNKHEVALLTLENNRQALEKLHKQFGHC